MRGLEDPPSTKNGRLEVRKLHKRCVKSWREFRPNSRSYDVCFGGVAECGKQLQDAESRLHKYINREWADKGRTRRARGMDESIDNARALADEVSQEAGVRKGAHTSARIANPLQVALVDSWLPSI